MLLLAGLHLFQLHVPVITTHLRTGRGGLMMGRAVRPLDAALCNCPVVATSTHKDYVILPGASAGPHCHLSNMPASRYF